VRIVFLGSGVFAIPSLEALLAAGHEVAAVVTQPDRASGRGRGLTPPPLKPVAQAHALRLLQPPKVRAPEVLHELAALAPDVQVVVAYGQILPGSLIRVPPLGTVNVHSSLLPKYRGAAPIHWAIVNGETETGVTTMLIDEGLDTGPLLLSRKTPIGESETSPELEARLAPLGAQILLESLAGLASGTLHAIPQDASQASLAPIIHKQDGIADFRWPAPRIANRIRGFQPWPGVSVGLRGARLKLLRSAVEAPGDGEAGVVSSVDAAGIVVACGEGTRLRLLEVQPDSRRAMPAAAFAAGAHLRAGDRFDAVAELH
jgi:methionyl-tRNA formyltransferase